MAGEGEADRHRLRTVSLSPLLFGEEKRRMSSMQPVFVAPAVASAFSSKPGGEESRSSSVTDPLDRPLSCCSGISSSCVPASASVTVDVGSDEGEEKEEERREVRTEEEGEEEEREKPLLILSNVDDNNEKEEGGGGEEQKDEEEEEEDEEEEQVVEQEEAVHGSHIRRYQRRLSFREVRHFPPPIPLLAQTGNLSCHMPWILKRSYKKDGRLVLREVKLKHHEFFRAHRSNGRLTLQLVHFEDSSRAHTDHHRHEQVEEEEEEEEEEEGQEEGQEGEEGEGEGTENDSPPSPASPRSSSSTLSPPPPASSTSTSDQDENRLHETNAPTPLSISLSIPSSSSSSFSSDSPSTPSSSSSCCNYKNDNEDNEIESSIKPDRTAVCIGENVNASMGIAGGCFANSLVQMPIPRLDQFSVR